MLFVCSMLLSIHLAYLNLVHVIFMYHYLQFWALIMYTLFTISAGDFILQADLEEAFIYIIHKPIDFSIYFSYSLKTYKSVNRNLVPSPNTEKHLLSLFELADRK